MARYGDLGWHAVEAWAGLAAGADAAMAECLRRRAAAMKRELAGTRPTPLEGLLAERVALTWLQASYCDAAAALCAAASIRQVEFAQRRQARAQRQYLEAVAALITTRKLLARVGPPAAAARAAEVTPFPTAGGTEAGGAGTPGSPPVKADDGDDAHDGGPPSVIPFEPERRDGTDRRKRRKTPA